MKTNINLEDMSTEAIVKALLRPLCIHCHQTQVYCDRYDTIDRIKMFECNEGRFLDFIDSNDSRCVGLFKDYTTLLSELFDYVKMFEIRWHGEIFDNPYFGCKSVEEAMIKMNLLGDKKKEDA